MQDDNASAGRKPSLDRRLATLLMADVFGYSRMMGENEERTIEVLRGHREVFDEMLKIHRGRTFNTAGDAILAEFPSAVDAVRKENPERCWRTPLTVQNGKLFAKWQGSNSSEPSYARGTISTEGAVDIAVDGFGAGAKPMAGEMSGTWKDDTIKVVGAWRDKNPMRATGNAYRKGALREVTRLLAFAEPA